MANGGDFNIDVGFNVRGFESAFGSNGRAPTVDSGIGDQKGDEKSKRNFAGGIITAFKGLGILTLLGNLKIIVDLLSVIASTINLGVFLFLKKVYEFFQDPTRGLLNFGLFLANLMLAGLEKLVKFTTGINVDVGRFRSDIIGQELDAGTGLLEAIGKGFLTEEQYQKEKLGKALLAKQAQDEAAAAQLSADLERKKLANLYEEHTKSTLNPAMVDASNAFVRFAINFKEEIERMNRALSGDRGVAFLQARKGRDLTASELFGATRLQSTTVSDRDARAFLYLDSLRK